MRRVALILPAALLLFTTMARAEKAYRGSVQGFQTASAEAEAVTLLLNAEGELAGTLQLLLRREGAAVKGGSWTLTVSPPGDDPTASEKGRLTGGVSGGTLTFDSDGALVKADSVQLTVQGGTGQFSGVKSGGGGINLSSTAENPSRLAGALVLNF